MHRWNTTIVAPPLSITRVGTYTRIVLTKR